VVEYLNALKYSFWLQGRLTRRGFWRFLFIHTAITLLLAYGVAVHWLSDMTLLSYTGMTLPATFSSFCRRLHDSGYSLGWVMIGFIPILGTLFLLYGLLKQGQPYHNRFGPNPRVWKDN
jgi:uncharacterized membrane protein YhaH (DUF805 family)